MAKYNKEYYEPLEQMMAVRHQYMSKILRDHTNQDIYNFFKNKQVLDLGCGTGEFLNNYFEMGAQCTGIDIEKNFKLKNKKNFNLYNLDANTFLKNCKKKFDIIFLFEFLEHLEEGDKHKLFESLIKILNKNALIFVSTLNKNLLSKYLAIDIAENILKLLPKKTHEFDLFLSPTQLQTLSQKYKLSLLNIEGLQYNPIIKSFKLSKVDLVNYIGALKY
ncbi:bifunctional 2-polyprenyl-6-hydroxyphenol methylase/3-demethylubiquinol 3-O-methyltransferase UbiG [Alphaproteobacteria bacterium]|nr:bifunctional 2-polyprenyl-6-hydroxyphenol methylase/3-demethylubiquinol 3-O-methyltransferase UbiG [Alphaproteobacteria bacterium]